MAKKNNLEDNFLKIEDILKNLESGSLSLEESFKQYSDGVKLVKECKSMIDTVEKQLITINEDGSEDGV